MMSMGKPFTALLKSIPKYSKKQSSWSWMGLAKARKRRKVRIGFSLLAFWLGISGCTYPFEQFDHLISFPWGTIVPIPADSTVIYDKSEVFFLSNRRGWSLTLTVRKPSVSGQDRFPLSEVRARLLLKDSRSLIEQEKKRRWIEGSLSWLGGSRGVRIDFEGPPEEGQASIYFEPGQKLFHRVAFLNVNKRLYRLHLQSLPVAKGEALRIWGDAAEGTHLSGRPKISFPNSEDLPESNILSMVRVTFTGEGKKRSQAQ